MDFEVVVGFLLSSGAHASCKDKQGCTPLILASSRGFMGAVDVLVEHLRASDSGTGLEEGDAKGRTALHWAAEEGQELVVAFLLRSGAQADCSDNGGVTPLMLASGKGLGGVAHLLVEYLEAPALEQRDAKGRTVLHWATEQGQELMVAFLLRNGAQAESSAPDGMTPLMCASCKGHVAVVRVLAQHMSQEGLGLEQRDAQASTALHWATINGQRTSFLLKNGAQATCRDVWGKTPLMTAANHNQMPAVRVLLSVLGTQELDEADTRGWTALHLAARSRGGEEIVRLLLLHGVGPSMVDHRGQTPRVAAQRLQRETCMTVFKVRRAA
jgi:ankyrin repeat protein